MIQDKNKKIEELQSMIQNNDSNSQEYPKKETNDDNLGANKLQNELKLKE